MKKDIKDTKCPHCGNDDTALMEVVGKFTIKAERQIICEVCAKIFWAPLGPASGIKNFHY